MRMRLARRKLCLELECRSCNNNELDRDTPVRDTSDFKEKCEQNTNSSQIENAILCVSDDESQTEEQMYYLPPVKQRLRKQTMTIGSSRTGCSALPVICRRSALAGLMKLHWKIDL